MSAFNIRYESLEDSLGGFKETRTDEIARWQRHVAEFLASGDLRPNAVILDFGSGSGQWSLFIASMLPQARIIGLDVADRAVESATQRARELGLSNVRFMHFDGRTVPNFAESFDCILCFGVLLYLEKEGVVELLLEQLDDRLQVGGWFCAMEIFHRDRWETDTFKTLQREALLELMARRGYQLRLESVVYSSKLARYWLQVTEHKHLRALRLLWQLWLQVDHLVDLVLISWLRLQVGERRFLVWRKH